MEKENRPVQEMAPKTPEAHEVRETKPEDEAVVEAEELDAEGVEVSPYDEAPESEAEVSAEDLLSSVEIADAAIAEETDADLADLQAEYRRPFMRSLADSKMGAFARRLMFAIGIASIGSVRAPEVGAENGSRTETREVFKSAEEAIFKDVVENLDLPDFQAEQLSGDDKVKLEVDTGEVELTRAELEGALDQVFASSDGSKHARGAETLYDVFDDNYGYTDSEGNNFVHTMMVDVIHKIHPSDEVLLDTVSGTSADEREELGRILTKDSFMFLPEGSMAPKGSIIQFDFRGEGAVSDYLDNEEKREFYKDRFDDAVDVSVGLMREVEYEELKGRDKENFRVLGSWIVRTQMDYATTLVKAADHVAHPDEAGKELHLFESMEAWGSDKTIDPVALELVNAQNEFNTAMVATVKFVEGLEHLDDSQKKEVVEHLNEYRGTVDQWQTDQVADLFEKRAEYDSQQASVLDGNHEVWRGRAEQVSNEGIESVVKKS